ncbi:hypothetical protein E4U41_005362, partial [Claviceps citrina]
PPPQDRDQDQQHQAQDAAAAAAAAAAAPRRRRKAPPTARLAAPPAQPARYIDVESVTTDAHLKGYHGPYDRGMRGQTLINTWYGPRAEDVAALQRGLHRWMDWTVLPPKHGAHGEDDDDDDDEQHQQEEQHHHHQQGHRSPRGEATTPVHQPRLGIRVLIGPATQQRDLTMYPGDAFSLTQSWVPYDADPSPDKLPTGWMLDAGGIVTGMDWCPGRQAVQLLALAVVPHADQDSGSNYNSSSNNSSNCNCNCNCNLPYGAEHHAPACQTHGTVQVWAFEGARMGRVLRPSPRAPRPPRTVCLPFGRARRVRWCPVPDTAASVHYMAVLCGDGRVCVVAYDHRDDDPSV